MPPVVIVALLVLTAIGLCSWGRSKRARRHQIQQDIKRLSRWHGQLMRTMQQPPTDGQPPCQTESNLVIESFQAMRRAAYMIGVAEGCFLRFERAQTAIRAIHGAELELTRADCLLKMVRGNLRPLIGRMRQAASQNLAVCCQIMDIALLTDPDSIAAESLCPVIHATEMAAEVAKRAPVRALNEHALMMRGAMLSLTDQSDD